MNKIRIRIAGIHPSRVMIIEGEIKSNEFDEHDTAAVLFAIEFAANTHSEIRGLRVHIEEKE